MNALIDLVEGEAARRSSGPGDDLFWRSETASSRRRRCRGCARRAGPRSCSSHDVPASKVRMANRAADSASIPSIGKPHAHRVPAEAAPPTASAASWHRAAAACRRRVASAADRADRRAARRPVAAAPAAAPVPQPVPRSPWRNRRRDRVEAKRVEAVASGANPFVAMPTFTPRPRDARHDRRHRCTMPKRGSSRAARSRSSTTRRSSAPRRSCGSSAAASSRVLKIVATSVVFVVIGVVIGAYIAFHGEQARTSAIAAHVGGGRPAEDDRAAAARNRSQLAAPAPGSRSVPTTPGSPMCASIRRRRARP